MLTSRTMFWTEDGLFWKCGHSCASERKVKLDLSDKKALLLDSLINYQKDDRIAHCMDYYTDRYTETRWIDVVEELSERAFTVTTDKLAAVSGLGTEISRITWMELFMGMWKHNMVQELAWLANFTTPDNFHASDPPTNRLSAMPSWTWASVDQKVRFSGGRYRLLFTEEPVNIDILYCPATAENMTQLQIRGCLGKLHLQKMETPGYTFSGQGIFLSSALSNLPGLFARPMFPLQMILRCWTLWLTPFRRMVELFSVFDGGGGKVNSGRNFW